MFCGRVMSWLGGEVTRAVDPAAPHGTPYAVGADGFGQALLDYCHDGKGVVPVEFRGVLPALFREGQGVVATGALNQGGTFVATEVLARHDEKYMPPEVVDALKKSGEWQRSE